MKRDLLTPEEKAEAIAHVEPLLDALLLPATILLGAKRSDVTRELRRLRGLRK